jgi:hypothetical protein
VGGELGRERAAVSALLCTDELLIEVVESFYNGFSGVMFVSDRRVGFTYTRILGGGALWVSVPLGCIHDISVDGKTRFAHGRVIGVVAKHGATPAIIRFGLKTGGESRAAEIKDAVLNEKERPERQAESSLDPVSLDVRVTSGARRLALRHAARVFIWSEYLPVSGASSLNVALTPPEDHPEIVDLPSIGDLQVSVGTDLIWLSGIRVRRSWLRPERLVGGVAWREPEGCAQSRLRNDDVPQT